jgi:hypothetical protein
MARSLRIETEKFNDKNFELWKLNMEDLFVDKEQWIVVHPGTRPTSTQTTNRSKEDWEKLDRIARSTIRLCVERIYSQGTMGKVGEFVSIKVPSKQVLFLKEVVSS